MDTRQIISFINYPDRGLVEFAVHRANLTAPEWDCIKAREYDGETVEKLAERLELSDTTIKRRYSSGMKKLDVAFSSMQWVGTLSTSIKQ
ncbi:MAG: sigma-70 family RNA polymerase sigma factor [Phascolarctobacterium sp.]|nr:sigma-70 family RNA polymerase sigma factor [Candidatus Phascolarctobacterium caballi]